MTRKLPALEYVDDSGPGITRRKAGRGWAYFDPKGKRITDRAEIDRLNAVGLPPAYTQAWFCPKHHGHLLATGTDARGRKQYRYNPEFRAKQEAGKFDGCAEFGRLLPRVRKNPDGELPFLWSALNNRLRRWLSDCEVRDACGRPVKVTAHQFRHTVGTRMINNEVSMDTVQRMLDHASPEMTARYATIKDQTLRRA